MLNKADMTSIKKSRKPSVVLVAGLHGDETGTSLVVRELFRRLRHKIKKGSVHALPLINKTGKRELFGEDLNRSFPGNKFGSRAERSAHKIFQKITKINPSFVLDLHNDWKKAIHYAVVEPGKSKAAKKSRIFAKAIGLPIIIETDKIERGLAYNLLKQNIPVVTLELGDTKLKDKKNIEMGIKSIWNVLSCFGIINKINKISREKVLVYSQGPKSCINGRVKFFIKPGKIIKKGQKIAEVYNKQQKESLMAKEKALILGLTDSSFVKAREQVVALGIF